MKIYLGSDHSGFHLKEDVFAYLAKHNYEVEDAGNSELDPSDDYPEFAQMAALRVIGSDDRDPRAVLIGGQGMIIAANRFHGIRACIAWDAYEAKTMRNDDDSNILCLPARLFENEEGAWQGVLETWLNTPFSGAVRYKRRNSKIDEL
jgi:ribose 5-phosphate isomerase B